MSSIWCPKCQFNKHREVKCPQCGFVEEDNTKTYKVPKSKPVRLLKGNKEINSESKILSKNFSEMTKNPILVGAVLIIAISVGYLAFSKYQENRTNEKWMKALVGTSDPDEVLENMNKQLKQAEKTLDKAMYESAKQQKELVEKMLINKPNN